MTNYPAWAPNTPYKASNPASFVSYANRNWICIVTHTSTAIFDFNMWMLAATTGAAQTPLTAAQKITYLQGIPGIQGVQGNAGPQGNQGVPGPAGPGVLAINSIQALRAYAYGPLADGSPIDVLGYVGPQSGGGGRFVWSAASTAADDGGMVINPAGNTGAGRWFRNLSGARPNSRMFGTLGQGADETFQLQAFFNAGGGTLSHPLNPGQPYIVGAPAANAPPQSVASLWVPSGCYIEGDAAVTIQQQRPGGQNSPIFPLLITDRALNGAKNIVMLGAFVLDLNSVGAAQPTLNSGNPIWGSAVMFRALNSILRDVTINNGWDNCLTVGDHGTDAENAYNAVSFNADATQNSKTLQNVTNVGRLTVNQFVKAAGLAAGTFIASITGNTVTLNNAYANANAAQTAFTQSGVDLSVAQQDVVGDGLRTNNGGSGYHTAYVPSALLGFSGNGIDVTTCVNWEGSGCVDRGSCGGFGFDTGGPCTGRFVNCTSFSARFDASHPENCSGVGFGSGQNHTAFIGCTSFYAGRYGFWFPSNKPALPYVTPTIEATGCHAYYSQLDNFHFNCAVQMSGLTSHDPGQICGFGGTTTNGSTTMAGVGGAWYLASVAGAGNPLALITGPGIPPNTYVLSANPNNATAVLSNAATATGAAAFRVTPAFDAYRVEGSFVDVIGYTLVGRAVDDIGLMAMALRELASSSAPYLGDGGVYNISGTVVGIDPSAQATSTLGKTKFLSELVDAPPARNWIINGNFEVNQRAYTSGTQVSNATYMHDRWRAGTDGCSYTFSQATTDTMVTVSTAINQIIDGSEVTATKAWVTWEGTSPLRVDQNGAVLVNFVPGKQFLINGTLVNGYLLTGLTVGAPLAIWFGNGTVGRVQVAGWPSAYRPPGYARRPTSQEFALCQAYYQVTGIGLVGQITSGNTVMFGVKFIPMRVAPAVTCAASFSCATGQSVCTVSGATVSFANVSSLGMRVNVQGTLGAVTTVGAPLIADTNAIFQMSAEL